MANLIGPPAPAPQAPARNLPAFLTQPLKPGMPPAPAAPKPSAPIVPSAAQTAQIAKPVPGKLSVNDFATQVKTKHPEYSSIDNLTLTNAVIAKYPEYARHVDTHSGVREELAKGNPPQGVAANLQDTPLFKFGQNAQDVAVGFAKGAVGTAQTGLNMFGPAVNRIANPISKGLGGTTSNLQQDTPESWKTTKNNAEKFGYGSEQVAETFVPVGGAGNEAAKLSGRVGSNLEKIVEYTKPVLTKAEEQAAKEAGQTATKGVLGKVVTNPSTYDKAVGEAARNAGVMANESFDKNIAKVNTAIEKEATQLSEGLKKTGAIWNRNQVVGRLAQIEPEKAFKSDATITNAYNIVKNKMIDVVEKQKSGTLDALLNARKEFDKFVQQELPNIYSREQMTPFKKAILDTRNALNQMIEERLPEGKLPNGTSFRESLRKQSLLFDARENIAAKAPKLGEYSNPIVKFAKDHPYMTGAAEAAGALTIEKGLKKYIPLLP